MKILDLAVVLAGLYVLGYCWHCELEEQTFSNHIEYDIDTKPHLTTNTGGYLYWISNMQFFVFGQIEDPSKAVITAGFYDKNEHNKLVYGVIVDCGAGTWLTNYINSTTGVQSIWKKGTLNKSCEENEYFDITYELQQRRRGKFMFNGQPMEYTLEVKASNVGVKRIQRLPLDLTNGTHFKAEIGEGGGNFDRYAYGKCLAYPDHLMSNCTEAKIWGMRRSKGEGEVVIVVNSVKYPTGYSYVGEFGAWVMGYDVNCWSKNPQFFSVVQSAVHADEKSNAGPYCCCSYMNGTLDESSCASWHMLGGGCTYTCSAYIDMTIYNTVMEQEELNAASSINDTFSNIVG